ncbi:aldehyde dehydrogenase family protein [Pseudomonas nabeulensis]|uniref:Aldehyde dehydrogenase family protein n=1 Tax=Pseudomonas nabeulensis TaxID=2293833 RepID=A0A4Z0B9U5_9PSED|nr:aldehyde dehydrogenase family protein [Pseudomonas nabeulensis]TFY95343.1 aldehyde dehydrogenase family protein [Pseudomonas nabeulensis]
MNDEQRVRDILDLNKRKNLIGGNWVDSLSGETLAIENPATGEIIAHVPRAGAADIDLAVKEARRAFEARSWRNMRASDRGRLLESIARKLEEHADELAFLEALDTGKAVSFAKILDLPAAIEVFRYMGGWCSKIAGKTLPVSFDGKEYHAYTRREAVGVVGAITPWNYPLALGAWKIASALAAGCTMVIKPTELTPLSTLRLVELCLEAGLPEGVLNVINGHGHEAGAALAQHPDVNKITFTGSTAVGKKIVEYSLGNLKRVTLELGGKSPSIVFDDADLDQVGLGAALAVFFNSGQICFAATRLFVQENVYDQVVEAVAAAAQQFTVGNGLDPQTMLGPLVSAKQQDRVLGYIESGVAQGARLVCGGKRIGDKGYFVEPTVFADATPSMKIVSEEIFGPVVSVMKFKDVEEVTRMANDSQYGLAANIWTRDIKKAHKLAHRLEAGSVWINCHGILDPALPFGGFKQSGWGREVSEEGLLAYTETKTVCMLLDE